MLMAVREGWPVPEQISDQVITDTCKQFRDGLIGVNDVYVASLCNPSDQAPDHGLLSQWRGYGQDGGYAVVFDRAGLSAALEHEQEKWFYNFLTIEGSQSHQKTDMVYEMCVDWREMRYLIGKNIIVNTDTPRSDRIVEYRRTKTSRASWPRYARGPGVFARHTAV